MCGLNFDLPAVPAHTVHRIFGERPPLWAERFAKERQARQVQDVRHAPCESRDVGRIAQMLGLHFPLHKTKGIQFATIILPIDFRSQNCS